MGVTFAIFRERGTLTEAKEQLMRAVKGSAIRSIIGLITSGRRSSCPGLCVGFKVRLSAIISVGQVGKTTKEPKTDGFRYDSKELSEGGILSLSSWAIPEK